MVKKINLWQDKWVNQGKPSRKMIYGPLMKHEQNLNIASIMQDGRINTNHISFDLPLEIINQIHSTYIKQNTLGEDSYNWNTLGHNTFSTKAVYELVS